MPASSESARGEEVPAAFLRRVRRALGVPYAGLTLQGPEGVGMGGVIGAGVPEETVVADAAAAGASVPEGLVPDGPVGFFAAVPLTTAAGEPVGGLYVADRVPRAATNEDLDVLRDFARRIAAEFAGAVVEGAAASSPPGSRRDVLLRTAAEVARVLTTEPDFRTALDTSLRLIGAGARADRVYLFENHRQAETEVLLASQRAEWTSAAVEPQIDNPMLQGMAYDGPFAGWALRLERGEIVGGLTEAYEGDERALLEAQEIRAFLLVPIRAADTWYGFVGLDDCTRERAWTSGERAVMETIASILGGVFRRRAVESERDRFFAVVPDLLAVATPGGRLLRVNSAWERVLGHPREALLERPLIEFVHPDDRERTLAEAERVRQRGHVEPTRGFENRYRCRDGSYRWLSWSSSAPDARGRIYTIARDVTEERRIRVEQERRRAEIRRSELRFRSFVNATAQVLWMADERGSVIELSDTWSEFTGQSKEQVEGWGWADAVHPDDRPRVAERWKAHVASRAPLSIGYRVRRRDGVYHLFDVRAVPVFDEDGSFVEWIGTCTDVEAARRAEAALVSAKERAEEMVRLKSSFLANMSHEIRTPLTSVIGFSEVLAEEMEGPERRIVEMINRSGRRLLETLNSVLDLAQLESRSLRLRLERVVLDEVAEDVVALFGHQADECGISLDFVPPDVPVAALADRGAVLRVLTNLVSNAIKFTDAGGVTVTVGADGDRAWVRVADTGVGIAPTFFEHMFEEFRQESSGDARSHEGNGLGLAITKRLVELMEGDIAVESTKGEGAIFTVRLPAAASR